MFRTTFLPACLAVLSFAACSSEIVPESGEFVKGEPGKADSSAVAVFLDFEFDGELVTDRSFGIESIIEDQLLYTIGQLNGDNSVGRLDKLELSDIQIEDDNGRKRVRYHAKMPVAWGSKTNIPSSHELLLPVDMSFSALNKFAEDYGHDCVDFGAHDVDSGSMWYYFRPERSSCDFSDGDVIATTAAVSMSSINTTGKYPEYHKIWEDDVLEVVAVFGKYEDGADDSDGDAGINAYNKFSRSLKNKLGAHELETVPAQVPFNPGVGMPEISYEATLDDGKQVRVVALLVDNVRTAGPEFTSRYEELSRTADLIVYNGHAGLGSNIRALAKKGDWQTGQYSIVFMNGCDTYAYIDSSLADAHAAVNPDDPTGTKYMDIVTNAMPSFFRSMSGATMALIDGLMDHEDPKTYEMMFRNVDRSEVVLVSGEQDNEFVPGNGGGQPVENWDGMSEAGNVAANEEARFETPTLAAGSYEFTLTGTNDADLYVRVGTAPSQKNFDCRPFLNGSNESCTVELTTAAPIHVMVRGWAASSDFSLRGQ